MATFLVADRRWSVGPAAPTSAEPGQHVVDYRAQFVAAADWMLATEGFANFKVRAVCRQAGLSTHCFYEVFGGKEELLAAMLERQFRVASEYLHRTIVPTLPPVERVWANVGAMIDFGFDRRFEKPMSLFATYWRALLPHYRELAERSTETFLTPLKDSLSEGTAVGVLYSADPAADAKAIYFLITALLLDRPPCAVKREELETTVRRFVSRALAVPEPASLFRR